MSDYITALTTVDAVNQRMTWETEGHHVVGDNEWQDIILTASLTYNGGTIGLTPRVYATNMYVMFTIENDEIAAGTAGAETEGTALATVSAQVTDSLINLDSKGIAKLNIGQSYELKAEIKRNNYKLYVDGQIVFNIEYATMPKGKVGVYATAGNSCSEIKVDSQFANGWTTNVATQKGAVVSIRELPNEDKYLYLQNDTASVYAQQTLDVVGGQDHTLAFNVKGAGTVHIIEADGASPSSYQMTVSDTGEWQQLEMTRLVKADCTKVTVRFRVDRQIMMVNAVQFEPKSYATTYIHNESLTLPMERESSFITYPSKNNIYPANGAVSMWVSPAVDHDGTPLRPTLFHYGTTESAIRLDYDGTGFRFAYGTEGVSQESSFLKGQWYHVVALWNQYELSIYVNNAGSTQSIDHAFTGISEVIRFGHAAENDQNVFLGDIDESILFKGAITPADIQEMFESTEPVANKDNMSMRATFNHAIGNFNKSHIEATLAPTFGSPIVIEKQDGTVMRKVSFFNYGTGEYQTYNEEEIIYDGVSDYLEVSHYGIDTENFKVVVRDEAGVVFGDPYIIEGNRIHFHLSEEEKDGLYGKPLFASYQLEDAYTVDFNIGVPDSFRINVGKHDGQPLKITYEGNDFHDHKLATMVELNPMLNPNHEGFLYITKNTEKVTSFRAKATPADLHADGVSEALVVIEPLDANGNFISHARIDVSAKYGSVAPNYDAGSINSKERAGRYLYKYRAAKLMQSEAGALEVTDHINVIDRETGIGVQIPLILTTIQMKAHTIAAGDTLQGLADMYGTTVVDIIESSTHDEQELQALLTGSVGTKVNIPQSYSKSVLDKSDEEKAMEYEINYVVSKLMEYLGLPVESIPEGLGAILDFNNDGIISVEEFTWVNENKRNEVLRARYRELVAWDESNAG